VILKDTYESNDELDGPAWTAVAEARSATQQFAEHKEGACMKVLDSIQVRLRTAGERLIERGVRR